MDTSLVTIEYWNLDRLVQYIGNPRKNDAVVDRMCASIREFGFKIPVLAKSNGMVIERPLAFESGSQAKRARNSGNRRR